METKLNYFLPKGARWTDEEGGKGDGGEWLHLYRLELSHRTDRDETAGLMLWIVTYARPRNVIKEYNIDLQLPHNPQSPDDADIEPRIIYNPHTSEITLDEDGHGIMLLDLRRAFEKEGLPSLRKFDRDVRADLREAMTLLDKLSHDRTRLAAAQFSEDPPEPTLKELRRGRKIA